MDNTDNSVAEQFIEQFNNGYLYSKHYPELSEKIVAQNQVEVNENSPISGVLFGMKEYLDGPEWKRQSQLRDIRNPQGGDKEHDIVR